MNRNEREKLFLENVRKELDAGLDTLDTETLLRLRHARQRALGEAERTRRRFALPKWVTAGGLATAMVVAVAVSFWSATSREVLPVQQAEDVEILTARDSVELCKDLEFYRWLEDDGNGR